MSVIVLWSVGVLFRLQKLQNQAALIITLSNNDSNTGELLYDSNWNKLNYHAHLLYFTPLMCSVKCTSDVRDHNLRCWLKTQGGSSGLWLSGSSGVSQVSRSLGLLHPRKHSLNLLGATLSWNNVKLGGICTHNGIVQVISCWLFWDKISGNMPLRWWKGLKHKGSYFETTESSNALGNTIHYIIQ